MTRHEIATASNYRTTSNKGIDFKQINIDQFSESLPGYN